MTPEGGVAYVQAQVACMLAELEGMKAANRDRERIGEPPVYREADFMDLPVRYGLHHNAVLGILR